MWHDDRWLCFCKVVDIAETNRSENADGQEVKVRRGSVKVTMDAFGSKWLSSGDAVDRLRKVEACRGYSWCELRDNDQVPDGVVWSGCTSTDGLVCVATDEDGRPGQLALAEVAGPHRLRRIL